jgi:peptidoglycan/LPS O-acetylase OafA/YrhL
LVSFLAAKLDHAVYRCAVSRAHRLADHDQPAVHPARGLSLCRLALFLSAFCLFLPYARAAHEKTALPEVRLFYQKRIARIVPSYAVSVLLIFFLVSVPSGAYRTVAEALKDLIPTLTFTQTFVPDALIGTKINGVLWTAAVEMQFYLFFPVACARVCEEAGWTYLGMLGISLLYLWGFALKDPDEIRLTVNQLPASLACSPTEWRLPISLRLRVNTA